MDQEEVLMLMMLLTCFLLQQKQTAVQWLNELNLRFVHPDDAPAWRFGQTLGTKIQSTLLDDRDRPLGTHCYPIFDHSSMKGYWKEQLDTEPISWQFLSLVVYKNNPSSSHFGEIPDCILLPDFSR